eukprot:7467626-Pyramimonas_sp.AAC.1
MGSLAQTSHLPSASRWRARKFLAPRRSGRPGPCIARRVDGPERKMHMIQRGARCPAQQGRPWVGANVDR